MVYTPFKKAKKTREYSLVESKAFHKGFLLFPFPWETGAAKKARYCMKKRLLSGLLLLAMLLTLPPTMALADDVVDYYIAVNGIDVTSENCTDVLKDGTVSYDPKTKTLTLKNADLSSIWAHGVDLTLKLVGTNTVSMNGESEGLIIAQGLTITGDGSLTVRNSYYSSIAIDLRNGAYIQKSGNVILHGSLLAMDRVTMLRLEGGTLKLEKGNNGFFDSNSSLDLPEGATLTLTDENGNTTTKTLTGDETTKELLELIKNAASFTVEKPVEEDRRPSLAEGAILLAGDDNPFRDVRAIDWYYEDVMYAYRRGLMNGTAYARFSPDSAFTRGMLLTILARYDGVRTEKGETWYEAGCDWAARNGISDGKNPEQAISREEFAEVLYRYAAYLGKDLLASADLTAYLDAGEVSGEATSAMQWAVGEAIVKGADFRLNPQNGTTRAEACAMLHRFFR